MTMNIKDRLRAGTQAAVRTEEVQVPGMEGVTVLVRGMSLGERSRVMAEGYDPNSTPIYQRLYPLVLALCTLDPASKRQIWNPNDLNDVDEINNLAPEAADAIFQTALRLSGMAPDSEQVAEGNAGGTGSANFSGSSSLASA